MYCKLVSRRWQCTGYWPPNRVYLVKIWRSYVLSISNRLNWPHSDSAAKYKSRDLTIPIKACFTAVMTLLFISRHRHPHISYFRRLTKYSWPTSWVRNTNKLLNAPPSTYAYKVNQSLLYRSILKSMRKETNATRKATGASCARVNGRRSKG